MNFKPEQLERFYKAPNPEVKCVILFGTNEGEIAMLQKKCVEAVCGTANDAFGCTVLQMENISKDGAEIYADYHAQSLMGGRRVTVVKNADNNLAPLLKSMLPDYDGENLLVISSTSLNTKSGLIAWAKDRADVITVGCYEERETDIAEDTVKMLQEYGISADAATIQALTARLSPDRKVNQSEIDKLALYLGERKLATIEDVDVAVSDVAGANFEDLCYYVAGGNVLKACNMFNRLIKEGEEPAILIRQIEYHFSKLLECAAKLEVGTSVDEALKSIRPPLMFYRKNDFMKQLRVWNKERILSALKVLYECERDCKTTGYPAEQVANHTVLRLSGAVKKFS